MRFIKPMKMSHFNFFNEPFQLFYPLVPLRVPHILLTKAGFDKSGEEGTEAPVGKFCISELHKFAQVGAYLLPILKNF